MNRAERRRGRWMTLNPKSNYDSFASSVDEDSHKLLMALLRQLVGPEAPFDDRTLWNSIRELIGSGLLSIHFRQSADGFEIHPEFLIPGDNDNRQRAGAA